MKLPNLSLPSIIVLYDSGGSLSLVLLTKQNQDTHRDGDPNNFYNTVTKKKEKSKNKPNKSPDPIAYWPSTQKTAKKRRQFL
jgi:hypothetical protein